MPYEIVQGIEGCAGFAVVKLGETDPVPGGCHDNRQDALDHLAALEIATEGENRAEETHKPTDAMRTEAQRGLDWRSEFGRGGTAVGIARARNIANGDNLPLDTVKRMASFFARHEVDKEAEGFKPGEAGYPSNGRIAWALWGGDPAQAWAARIVAKANKERFDMTVEETRDMPTEYPLSPMQAKVYGDLEDTAELFGKFDKGTGASGAHYMEPDANPFASDGMICANCAFYEGPRSCEIVAGEPDGIDPMAICKFWVIPETLLSSVEPTAPATDVMPMGEDASSETPVAVRYAALPVEARKVNGRDVEFRTVEVGGLVADDAAGSDFPKRFSGYAAVFDSPSEPLPFTETIAPGAFKRSLGSGREIRAYVNHDSNMILGTTRTNSLRLVEDARGLKVDLELPDTTYARDLSALLTRGDVHSMSFGFSVPTGGDSWSSDGTSRELREVILHEVSVVTGFPAYPATHGATVRSTDTDSDSDSAAEPTDETKSVELARRYLELTRKRK